MLEPRKKMYDKAGPRVAAALQKRNMEAYYCPTAAEAVEKVLELIPAGDVVSWGGVATVDELGIKGRLRSRNQPVIDRDTARTPEERTAMLHQALTCDTFLMSSNAISEDGQLVNIDGIGNRVAALCFGPKQVIVVARHEQGGRRSGWCRLPRPSHRRPCQRPALRRQDALRCQRPVRRLHQPRLHLLPDGHHTLLQARRPHQGGAGRRGAGL